MSEPLQLNLEIPEHIHIRLLVMQDKTDQDDVLSVIKNALSIYEFLLLHVDQELRFKMVGKDGLGRSVKVIEE